MLVLRLADIAYLLVFTKYESISSLSSDVYNRQQNFNLYSYNTLHYNMAEARNRYTVTGVTEINLNE